MAAPAGKFSPSPAPRDELQLWAPADLEAVATTALAPDGVQRTPGRDSWPDAIEIDRLVPASGNMTVGPQQFWLGISRVGQQVRFWIDITTVHMSIAGWRIKTVPSRLSAVDLAGYGRLMRAPPDRPRQEQRPASWPRQAAWKYSGWSTLPGSSPWATRSSMSVPLAGQRARIRLDGQVMHVITQDGVLWRTLPCAVPPGQRHRLQGVRLAGPDPLPQPGLTIQPKVSSRGGIQVARQRIQAGMTHAGPPVPIDLGDTSLRVIDQHGELITTVSRVSNGGDKQVQGPPNPAAAITALPGPHRLRRAFTASTSLVLALARCGHSTPTPPRAPALTGTSPGTRLLAKGHPGATRERQVPGAYRKETR